MFQEAKLAKNPRPLHDFFIFAGSKIPAMAKIIAFAGSNSTTSINFQLVKYTCDLVKGHDVQLLNLSRFPFPMYSIDLEKQKGFSNSLIEFRDDIAESPGMILSVNEHNGNPSAYFKNVVDWLSRLERNFLTDTRVLLMSTSPGKRGGKSSLTAIEQLIPRFGGEVLATFSLPSFKENFDANTGITDSELKAAHERSLEAFLSGLQG